MGTAQLQWNLDITKGQGTENILFIITRFRYIEVLFHIFYYYWGKKQKQTNNNNNNNKNVRYSEDIQNLPFFRLKSTWIFLEFLWIVGSGAADQKELF